MEQPACGHHRRNGAQPFLRDFLENGAARLLLALDGVVPVR